MKSLRWVECSCRSAFSEAMDQWAKEAWTRASSNRFWSLLQPCLCRKQGTSSGLCTWCPQRSKSACLFLWLSKIQLLWLCLALRCSDISGPSGSRNTTLSLRCSQALLMKKIVKSGIAVRWVTDISWFFMARRLMMIVSTEHPVAWWAEKCPLLRPTQLKIEETNFTDFSFVTFAPRIPKVLNYP